MTTDRAVMQQALESLEWVSRRVGPWFDETDEWKAWQAATLAERERAAQGCANKSK